MQNQKAVEQPDPEYFGTQPNGTYAPAPSEIEDRCNAIRERWSIREKQMRAQWAHSGPYILPTFTIDDSPAIGTHIQ